MLSHWFRSVTLATVTTLVGVVAPLSAQDDAKAPVEKAQWAAAHDVKVRPGKEADWSKSLKLGVEVFRDPAAKSVLAITSAGSIAVAPEDAAPGKEAKWSSGVSFSVRKHTEEKFTAGTQLYGAEVFKESLAGHLLYITERNNIALFSGTGTTDKDPQFQYGLNLKVRKPGVKEFDDTAKSFGLEAYKDNNTGGLVYVSELGTVAVAKYTLEKTPEANEVKKPEALYGLECRVRKPEEKEFDKAQLLGIEVYKDNNTGGLIYISESGSIATVPAPADMKKDQGLQWKHAHILRARPGGVADFAKATTYNVEVFTDANTGYLVYITNTGSIAVLPK